MGKPLRAQVACFRKKHAFFQPRAQDDIHTGGGSLERRIFSCEEPQTLEETDVLCSGCNVVDASATTLEQFRTAVQEHSTSNESFFLLASFAGMGTAQDTAQDVRVARLL